MIPDTKNKITHVTCRRCSNGSFKRNKKVCVSCGFPRSPRRNGK